MGRPGSRHHIRRDSLIKGGETAAMVNRQRQKIGVVDLTRPEQPLPENQADLRQASARRAATAAAGWGLG